MAKVAIRDLLEGSGVEKVGVADLNVEGVRSEVSRLADDRLSLIQADARDTGSLRRLMKDWNVVINSTWYELNLNVMNSAISAGIHYVDLGGLYHMTLKQLELNPKAKDSGVTCVLGLGSSPGITNLMASLGASRLTGIEKVKIRSAGATSRPEASPAPFTPPYSFRTILDEACLPAVILRDGKIREVPGLSVREEFTLPEPVGRVEGYYTLHSELATLPKTMGKGVQDMDFIVAFSPEFSRALTLLVALGLGSKEELDLAGKKVAPYDLLTKVVDNLPRPSELVPDVGIRRVELFGEREGRETHLIYDCFSRPHTRWKIGGRSLGTGIPASIGAQWLAKGLIKLKGVLPPESCIDPLAFLHEMSEHDRGIETFENVDGVSRLLS